MNWRKLATSGGAETEDPKAILREAWRELRAAISQAKTEVVTAVAERTYFWAELDRAERRAREMERAARLAEARSQEPGAKDGEELARQESCIQVLRQRLLRASGSVGQVQRSARETDLRLRENAYRQLAGCTDWSAEEIERRLARGLPRL